MINSEFKKDVEKILAQISEYPYYKICFKGAHGGNIKTKTFKSRTVVPFKLLQELSANNMIAEQELCKLITEQLCMETFLEILKSSAKGNSEGRLIEYKYFAYMISDLGYDSIIVSSEIACRMQEEQNFEFNKENTLTGTYGGLYLFGSLKGKNVYVNASLPTKVFYALNFGNMEFKASVDDESSEINQAHISVFAQYNDNILICSITDIVSFDVFNKNYLNNKI